MRPATLLAATLVFGASLMLFTPYGDTHAYRRAQTGAITPCNVEAYLNDPDPKGVNVRSGPGNTFKVIGNLPNADVNGIVVHITGAQGDWMRIDRADEQGGDTEDRVFFKGVGWVYGPLLSVDGVGWIPGGTKIYKEPSLKSAVLLRMSSDSSGTLRGCRGKWIYMDYKKVRGWAAPGTTCSNSLTTCS